MAKVEMTLDELLALINQGSLPKRKKTFKTTMKSVQSGETRIRKPRKKTAWDRHLKSFKFRKQKRNESNSAYFGARTKAASRAYKRRKK